MKRKEVTDRTCIRESADVTMLSELRKEAQSNDHLIALATLMAVVGNETRLRTLYVLWRAGELCVCDLADIFGITQPAVSRHLKILREKALVETRRDAQTIYYRVCSDNPFSNVLVRLFEEQETGKVTLNFNLSDLNHE